MARNITLRKPLKRIAIVGDGFTEKIYFEQLKEFEQLSNFAIKPELPRKSKAGGSYKRVLETAKDLSALGYDFVYALIDYDTVISENASGEFDSEIADLDDQKISVYINNPCFETWILLHYERTGKLFKNCDEVERQVVTHIKDYCKNQEYLEKKNIYKCLRPEVEKKAIPNAQFLEKNRGQYDVTYPRAEVYKFLTQFVIRKS
jgi:hypothetical protein